MSKKARQTNLDLLCLRLFDVLALPLLVLRLGVFDLVLLCPAQLAVAWTLGSCGSKRLRQTCSWLLEMGLTLLATFQVLLVDVSDILLLNATRAPGGQIVPL